MELEVMMRKQKLMSKEEREELNIQKLLPNFDEQEYLEDHMGDFIYVPVTIDVRDALPYSAHDDEHTQIFLRNGLSFIAKVPYETFRGIRMAMMGNVVKLVEDFTFNVDKPKQQKRK